MRSNTGMAGSLGVRTAAALLAAAAFLPWYSSQAQIDHDTYLGNPLPLIDWVVLVAALAVIMRPQLAVLAGALGLVDVALGALMLYGDVAEGLHVSLGPGLPLATVASVDLLLLRPKTDLPNEVAADSREDRPTSV